MDPLNPPETPGMVVSACDLSTREEETSKGSQGLLLLLTSLAEAANSIFKETVSQNTARSD